MNPSLAKYIFDEMDVSNHLCMFSLSDLVDIIKDIKSKNNAVWYLHGQAKGRYKCGFSRKLKTKLYAE